MKRILSGIMPVLLTLVVLLFSSLESRATHIFGCDLNYTWLHDSTYKISLVVYGDCSASGTAPFTGLSTATPTICIFNGSATTATTSFNLAIQAPTTGVEVTPVCTADTGHTQCTSTSYTTPGVKKFVYSANYTFPSRSTAWRIVFNGAYGSSSAGRSSTIDNISGAGSTIIQLVDTLNNTTYTNNSPNLTVLPTPFFCTNRSNNYNPGAVDADGDSLVFALVTGRIAPTGGGGGGGGCNSGGSNVTYTGGASAGTPIRTTSSYSFNPANGQISYTTTLTQRALGVYNVREYRGGVLVGTSQREMTFLILTCAVTPPSGNISSATNGTITDTVHYAACTNSGPTSFHIVPTAADTSYTINVTTAGLPTGSTFVVTNNGTNHPDGLFSWNTTGVATGNYTFYVTYTDNACPLSGNQTIAYTVTINPQPHISPISGADSVCVGASITLTDTTTTGVWSSDNTALASVSPTGIVTGINGGQDTIRYTFTNSCGSLSAAKGVYVKPLPDAGIISGTNVVCPGSTVTLSETVPGGTWSTVFPAIASVSTAGVVTGITNGVDTIKYTVTNTCGTAVARFVVTVNSVPNAGTITGSSTVCQGASTTLTNAVTGGVWSSVFTGIASVSATGVVTGISPGVDTIKYTVTQTCGTAVATFVITVTPLPTVGAISGPTTVCEGATITLVDGTAGGTWTSVFPAIATVSSTGVVTGVAAGVDTIKYTITNSCGTVSASYVVTVNPLPLAGVITSPSNMCPGNTTVFTETVPGGTWSSSNAAIATVNPATGSVTAVSVGAVNITYTVTNACGSAFTFEALAVNSTPNPGGISGTTSVCVGATTALADTITGGVWTSSNTSVATISATGVVTGVVAGTTTISYTVTTSCGTATTSITVTVNPLPNVAAITGTTVVCPTFSSTLSDATTGGTWSSSNTAIATVNATGTVTGVASGTAIITYSLTTSCGTAMDTALFTVSPLPNAGLITGSDQVCIGLTTSLTPSVTGGVWSVNNAARASITTSGVVTGITTGTFITSYTVTNSCGSASDTMLMRVSPAPTAGTITGPTSVCLGSDITLSNTTTGGTWIAPDATYAVITSGGVVTGTGVGTTIISYAVTNLCGTVYDTMLITILPLPDPGTITGTTTVCPGATTTLSDAISGGVWSTVDASVASISSTGVVTGVAASTTIISYTVTNSCGSASATTSVTVSPLPTAGVITGTTTACPGNSSLLADAVTGGTWTTSNAAIASVNSGGFVTAVASGTAIITYTVTNSCGSANDTALFTVSPLATAGTITGTTTVCVGANTTLADATSGGVWSTSNAAVASVSTTGVVTGVSAGSATISYTVTNSCGPVSAIANVTVNGLPSAGSVSGSSTVCIGSSITLTASVAGGTWTASNTNGTVVGTSSTTALFGGNSSGFDTVKYKVTNTCGADSTTFVVNVGVPTSAGTITGPTGVCVGANITLTNTTTGGTWSSSNTTIASINTTGTVFGRSAGTAIITYLLTSSCGASIDTQLVTVAPAPTPGTITGPTSVCSGSNITLVGTVAGGTWGTSNASIASVSTTGVVTGVSAGSVAITYTITNACSSVFVTSGVTVDIAPDAGSIAGPTTVCIGTPITLTDASAGGVWSTSDATVASVSTTGVVTGLTTGTATITYRVSNSCGSAFVTSSITVNSSLTAGTITGPSAVCIGAFIALADATTGGVWSTSDASVASVDASGNVTGVATGSATISYTVTNSCGTASATATVNVSLVADAGVISGSTTICVGTPSTLTESISGGTWSTSDASVASISAGGTVTGVAAGSANITYTVVTGCGSAFTAVPVTVTTSPTAGSISGPSNVCVGSSIALTDAVTGGTWSTGNAAIASVDASGNVTGVATGVVTISYTVTTTCGTASATTSITVSPAANAGTIGGTTTVCVGASTTLTETSSGGVWTTSNAGIASVNSVTGAVTGIAAGSANITYTVTTACATAFTSTPVTVNPLANAGSISGPSTLCVGTTITLTDAAAGGTWSTSNAGIASVNAAGAVTGVANGVATITYTVTNSCGTATATQVVTVSPTADAGTIGGTTTICVGGTSALTETASGGVWSSSNAAVASVTGSGLLIGLSSGSATITYTVTTGCASAFTTIPVTVNPNPVAGTISGPSSVCAGSIISLTDATTGGTWSSSDNTVATVTTSGAVTGVAAGSAIISYSVTNSCGTANATHAVTVNAAAVAGTISGTTTLCVGASSTLSETVSGGVWSTSSAAVASISAAGVLTGVSAGSANITYTVTTACGSAFTTTGVTINPNPDAGSIAGPSAVCVGGSITLSDATAGGTWSTSNAGVASVSGTGLVSGVSAGTATISYTVTNSCGTANAVATVNVSNVANAGAISGATTVCAGSSTTLTDAAAGGVWSTSNAGVASVNSSGVVTGVASGSATITYTVTTGCSSAFTTSPMTVNPVANAGAITGPSVVCNGSTITLVDGVSGGTWATSNAGVASVDGSGVVTGISTGAATISYTVTNSCGTATTTFTVNSMVAPNAGAISGAAAICIGSSSTLSETVSGGTWSSSNTALASVNASGVVRGVAAGTAVISYTVTNACGTATATYTVAISAFPNAGTISGPSTICLGVPVTYTDTMAGGTWSSGDTTIARVDASGVVTGLTLGSTNIYYSVTNACGATNVTISITVVTPPTAGTISGTTTVCPGASSTLSATVSGGTWSSSNTAVATVSGAGVVTGVATGSAVISYGVTGSCGTVYATTAFTVTPDTDHGSIGGATTLCAGTSTTLSETVSGGTWSTSDASIASVGATGVMTGVVAGTATISYTVSGTCGTSVATLGVTITPATTAGAVSGPSSICLADNATFTSTVSGGTWSSSNSSIASVSSTGVVTGVAAGSATISYSVTGSCGTAVATAAVTISTVPNEGFITGATTVCMTASTTLTESVTGGVWSSGAPAVASVSSTGTVTGISAGTVIISYTVTNGCGMAVATAYMTVGPLPDAGTIAGPSALCIGTPVTMTDTAAGGTWSTSDASVASVNASGVVTPVATGTATISYTKSNSCGSATATASVTVDVAPTTAGTVSTTTPICPGVTVALTSTVTGGSWSTSDASVASVDAAGNVTAVAAGTATISYTVANSCGSVSATSVVTVNTGSSAGTITAAGTSVCEGSTITLADATAGGVWSTDDASIASVDASGNVTGVTAGTTIISYTVTNSCGTSATSVAVNVNALPTLSAIGGPTSVCEGTTATLSETYAGGTWSSSDASIASIDASTGDITGISAGTVTVTYTATTAFGCSASITASIAVNPAPSVAGITGAATSVCAGSAISFSDATAGGTWSTSDASVASVDASGTVTGVAAGTAVISYSVTNSCGTADATVNVNVFASPVVSAITGATSLCAGTTTTLSNTAFGGTWVSSNTAIATINSGGDLTGITAGIVTISYTVTNAFGCSTMVTTVDTVNPGTDAGTITAPGTSLCAGATLALTDAAAGGTWSSSDASIASVDASGLVTGVTAGTVTITYSVASAFGCGTFTTVDLTINPLPTVGPILGTNSMCIGSSVTHADVAFGGVWTSSDASIASVGASSGVVTGVAAGTATITYSVTNVYGCSATVTTIDTVSVMPSLTAIGGPANVCEGAVVTLTNGTAGGTWTSSDATIASVDATTGTVSGVAAGTATISYSMSTSGGCSATVTTTETVDAAPVVAAITGATSVCAGSTTTLADVIPGGGWFSSDATVASVSATGDVTGLTAGAADIYYTVTNAAGCSSSAMVTFTVNGYPIVPAISGTGNACLGAVVTLTDATTGGVWSSSDVSVASVDATSGDVYGISLGTATITYVVTGAGGCATTVTITETVNALPTVSATTGASNVCEGSSITLTNATTGGTWSSSDNTIASVDATGNVTGMAGGVATISYTVTNAAGCTASATSTITVDALPVVPAISGTAALCLGATATYTDAVTGGTWSTSDASVASVSSTGTVVANAVGSAVISYTVVSGAGCSTFVTLAVTVNPMPTVAAITGTTSICEGTSTTLADVTTGGVWSSSNTSVATVDASTGVVTAVAAGTANIMYSVTSGAGCTTNVAVSFTVNPLPVVAAITGASGACIGSSAILTDASAGGTWSTSDASIASISSSGVVTGVAAGTVTITYTVTNASGCTASAYTTFTVNNAPTGTLNPASGSLTLCHGLPVNIWLSGTSSGSVFQWYRGGVAIAGATNSNYIADTVGFYTVTISNGGCSITLSGVTVIWPPVATITHGAGSILFTGSYATYQWYLNGSSIAGATSSVYHYSTPGSYTVIVSDGNGCVDTSNVYIVTNGGGGSGITTINVADIRLYPNPTAAMITIDAPVKVNVSVMSPDGKVIIRQDEATSIDVSDLANGMYMIMIYDQNNTLLKTDKFMKVN